MCLSCQQYLNIYIYIYFQVHWRPWNPFNFCEQGCVHTSHGAAAKHASFFIYFQGAVCIFAAETLWNKSRPAQIHLGSLGPCHAAAASHVFRQSHTNLITACAQLDVIQRVNLCKWSENPVAQRCRVSSLWEIKIRCERSLTQNVNEQIWICVCVCVSVFFLSGTSNSSVCSPAFKEHFTVNTASKEV